MKKIRVDCPECNSIDTLNSDQVILKVIPDTLDIVGIKSYYTFFCVPCLTQIKKRADKRTVELLLIGDVLLETSVPDSLM